MRFQRRSFGGRRFESSRFESDVPKPVNVGEEYDVEITEEGSRGDGIARIKNFVVFVANAKKGEKAKIKIKEVRNRFAIGEKAGEGAAEATETEETEVSETGEEKAEEETAEESKESEKETEEEGGKEEEEKEEE